jgi:hypothetical protein
MTRRDYERAIRSELDKAGAKLLEFKPGGKHYRCVFQIGQAQMMHIYPGSPSDCARGVKNNICSLRRSISNLKKTDRAISC